MSAIAELSKQFTQTIIDEVDVYTTYIGFSDSGIGTSDLKWVILKISTAGTITTFKWAQNYRNSSNSWDQRSSYDYVS
jgi:hypothetical protein